MKNSVLYIVLFLFVFVNTFAQSDNITNQRYTDKFLLAKDILNAVQKHDIPKINLIAKQLNIPYSLYQSKIFPLYTKDSTGQNSFPKDEMYPDSWYTRDSNLYNKYAADFYFGKFIQAILNDSDADTTFTENIYLAFDKTDSSYSNNLKSNYLGILYENSNYVKVIDMETLATLNNQLFSLRQVNYYSYEKDNLPAYLKDKMPDNIVVYKLSGNTFVKYEKDTVLFSNINYELLSQESENVEVLQIETETEPLNDTDIFDRAEVMPEFPGGTKGLMKYLKANLYYPKEAQKKKLEGKVFVKFVVDKNGNIKNPVVLKDGVGGGAAEEAIRLVAKMPKWWPGKQNGKAVKVYFTLPIIFSLSY